MEAAWLPAGSQKQPLAVCVSVCMRVRWRLHISGCVCVCERVRRHSMCVFFCVSVSSRRLQWKTLQALSLSPPLPHYLLPRSPVHSLARLLARCSTQARRLCVSLFLSHALSCSVSYYLTRPRLKDRRRLILGDEQSLRANRRMITSCKKSLSVSHKLAIFKVTLRTYWLRLTEYNF